jgi:hypothetical protein
VPVLFTIYIQGVLILKKKSGAKGLTEQNIGQISVSTFGRLRKIQTTIIKYKIIAFRTRLSKL